DQMEALKTKSKCFPTHKENRMENEGNVKAARESFLHTKNKILYQLVKQRFFWMNDYIPENAKNVIELGCGAGLSKQFIKNKNLLLTDVLENEWVDKYEDALNLDYSENSLDVILCSHMIHHIANPASFFDRITKYLCRGGVIIIQDIYTSWIMKTILRIMRHEGYDDFAEVFDRNAICNEPNDPWSANCSIPKLIFSDKEKFEKEFPELEIIKYEKNECFMFLLSGGVIAKTHSIPVGKLGVKLIAFIDKILIKLFPSIFTCGVSVVLQKR
ncbi:MAG: class I SAM-dependent methyltransferase, partial [Treponema sp.]